MLQYFIKTVFTPLSLMMCVGAQGAFGIMTVLLYQFTPLLAVVIFCSYTVFFLAVMIPCFIIYKRSRNHYNKVFNK